MNGAEIQQTTEATQVGVYSRFPVAFARGNGSRLWDVDGREYLDFFSGLAVSNLGHSHPKVLAAIHEQADRFLHLSNLYYHEAGARLGALLVDHSFADRVFFANSGAEANEAAIKLARKYGADVAGGRYEIVTTFGSFHGRTMATVSATAQEKHQVGFQPMLQGFRYVPFGDLGAMEAAIRDETIAVLVEPIQGEGGVVVPPEGYLAELRDMCHRREILLILDEVQVGVGRTGKLFAYEHYGIEPDLLTLAKALGGGLPLGAMLTTERVAKVFGPGAHGSTFGGNPVSCAAGVAVVETLLQGDLLHACLRGGEVIRERLERIRGEVSGIRAVRGLGYIFGIELETSARPIVERALERGLLVNVCAEKVLRLLPPLVISEEELDRGLSIVEELLRESVS